MKRASGTRGGSRGFKARPAAAAAWREFRDRLSYALAVLDDGEFLVVMQKTRNRFVQFAGQGEFGMRAEAVSNSWLEGKDRLTRAACAELEARGWNPPTFDGRTHQDAEPAEGSPNFYLDVARPVPFARLAALAVATLRDVYGVRAPGDLEYHAFSERAPVIRFCDLGISRQANPLPATGPDDPSAAGAAAGAAEREQVLRHAVEQAVALFCAIREAEEGPAGEAAAEIIPFLESALAGHPVVEPDTVM